MNPLIFVVIGLCLLSVIGLVKKNREIFLTGYFIYGLLVFGVEINQFINENNETSLFVAFLWLIQSILAVPVKAKYDSLTVMKDRIKICLSLSVINLTGVILPDISPMPDVTCYIHSVMAILPLVVIFLLSSGRIKMEK